MRVAIVGTGPTGVYAFQNLIRSAEPLVLVLFDQADTLGVGMPYRAETASKEMLANIASIEIPPLTESYLDWMRRQPASHLRGYGLDPENLDDRDFTPRLLLGEYFRDQLAALVALARQAGHIVHLRPGCRVTDVASEGSQLRLRTDPEEEEAAFDRVILATGHVFAQDNDLTDHYFPNPWSGLLQVAIPACRVGVMGTSLSAIDAAMAVANQHGRFRRGAKSGALRFETEVSDSLTITLMSWTGVLPEADFYCPIPYLPLQVMTPEALAAVRRGQAGFDAVYALFREEIRQADPAWAEAVGLQDLDPEGFHDAYFHDRLTHDPFDWARRNLAEVEANKLACHTVEWRYAILRMHEVVEEIVPDLSKADLKRFEATLKPVFVDNYAAVPSESVRRLLALHQAGVLEILALGEDYDLTHKDDRSVVMAKGVRHVFDIFIDARGQQPMEVKDMPFPTLRADLLAAGQSVPELGEDYGLRGVTGYEGRLYLAALPYLLKDEPFVQGITASAEIGETIARAEARRRQRRRRAA